MEHILNAAEVRVLGALIEKEITTPDYYPLSLNALMAACNQSSNRSPIVHFDEDAVGTAADSLREKGLVHLVDRGESRVLKYRHVLYEAMNLGRQSIAVMCVLMLRGPQTLGELKQRTERLHRFASLDELPQTLAALAERELAALQPRRPGQRDDRYVQLLGDDGDVATDASAPPPESLEKRVQRLEEVVAELQRRLPT